MKVRSWSRRWSMRNTAIVAPTPSADPANAQTPAESAPVDPEPAVGPALHPSNTPGSSKSPIPRIHPTQRKQSGGVPRMRWWRLRWQRCQRDLPTVPVTTDIWSWCMSTPTSSPLPKQLPRCPPAVPTSIRDDDASGLCRIENGPGLSRSEVLRISCDSALVTLIDSAVPGEQSTARPKDQEDLPGTTTRFAIPRWWVPVPRMPPGVPPGCPPCTALGRRRSHRPGQPGVAVPAASHGHSRRRLHRLIYHRNRFRLAVPPTRRHPDPSPAAL